MTKEITKEQYVKNPCGTCATAFWKSKAYLVPKEILVVHEKDIGQFDADGYNAERYFRLHHDLKQTEQINLSKEFYFKTVDCCTEKQLIKDFINSCYKDIAVSVEEVESWTKTKVFDGGLWLGVYEKQANTLVALGIADFDKDIKEGSLEWIQVLPEKQGCGLGKAIVNELLSRLASKAAFVTVSGKVDNQANPERLYRSCGFSGNDIWHVLRKKPQEQIKNKEGKFRLSSGDTVLRVIEERDLADYIRWMTNEVEWMQWDAPWEKWTQQDVTAFMANLKKRIAGKRAIHYRLEIETSDGEHIGWVSSYDIDGDEEKLAVGIDICEKSARRQGHAYRALSTFIQYLFEKTGKDTLYTQTWSGNLPMIRLAEKLGFSVCACKKDFRSVEGKLYDGLTFLLKKTELKTI